MDAHHAEQLPGRLLDRDKCHGAGVIDLREPHDEAMAEFLHRRKEAKAQIVRRHRAQKRWIERLILGPDRSNEHLASVRECQVALPGFRIGPDGKAWIAGERPGPPWLGR